MEFAPLFLLLLLPPSDATGEMADALSESLRSELGDVAMAAVPDRLVTPAMLDGENPPYRTRFVAHVTWSGRDKASIEIQSGREAKTATPYRASRVVSFSHRDRKSERGRAIGLVIAGLLRDSPPAVSGTVVTPPPVPSPEPAHTGVGLSALFCVQRAKSGTWAVGPVFSLGVPLTDALGLQISAGFLAADNYWQVPTTAEVAWRFLRSHDNRRALALGLGAVVLRESTSVTSNLGDHSNRASASPWNVGGEASLSGYVTVWRSLRLLARTELQALIRSTSVVATSEDDNRISQSSATFSRWRPAFFLGVGYSM